MIAVVFPCVLCDELFTYPWSGEQEPDGQQCPQVLRVKRQVWEVIGESVGERHTQVQK